MKSIARQMVALYKVEAIYIDYLQILQWHDQRIARHEQVAAISVGTKELARELNIPIIALSQLKRDAEGREPEMADLDYSKQIEQDADAIVLIYHPKPTKDNGNPNSMLLVKKNRDGPKGAVFVNFQREYVRFYETRRD
jgi:replicative DNA helicase